MLRIIRVLDLLSARWKKSAMDNDDSAKAEEHAEIAKGRAWCDGPPNYYKPA